MFSLKSIVLIAAIFVGAESSAVLPAVAAAPLIAPAQVGYAHAVPQNVAPYASQISVVSKAISPIVSAPVAAPFAAPIAPIPFAARFGPAAAYSAPFGAAPYLAAPTPYAAAAYGYPAPLAAPAAYAAHYPYAAAAAPLVRAPYGFAPAFVR